MLFKQKLVVPTLAHSAIERSDLIEQLDQTLELCRAVILTAPAGWGKTTLLSQWARRRSTVIWYSLDRDDRDPYRFLAYLLSALGEIVPKTNDFTVQNVQPQDLPELFRKVAAAIAAAAAFTLVLDDLHTITEQSTDPIPDANVWILDFLALIIEYAPDCSLVVASRTLPTAIPGLIRLAAQRRVAVFDHKALQFQPGEVQHLAHRIHGIMIGQDQAQDLIRQLDGWATGIVLALDQLRGNQSLQSNYGGTTEQVYAFLIEQIIAPLPSDLQCFLEETSVLDDLSPQRCDALREHSDSVHWLKEINRRNLFTSRRGAWLSLHSLFREFLRQRLSRDPERERELLLRAASIYADEGDLERAVESYLEAAAREHAYAVVRAAVSRLRNQSRQSTLLACLDRLSHGQILPPDLLLAQAQVYSDLLLWERADASFQLVHIVGDQIIGWEAQILRAESLALRGDIAAAQDLLDELPTDIPPQLALDYSRVAGRLAIQRGDPTDGITWLETIQKRVRQGDIPKPDSEKLAVVADMLGAGYGMVEDLTKALSYLQRADTYWQASGNLGRRVATLNNLGIFAMKAGQTVEARNAFVTALRLARETGRWREEVLVCWSLGDLDVIEGHVEAGYERFIETYTLAQRMNLPAAVAGGTIGAMWMAIIRDDLPAALEWQQRVNPYAVPPETRGRWALARGALYLLEEGADVAAIAPLLDEAQDAAATLLPPEQAVLQILQSARRRMEGQADDDAPTVDLPDTLLQRLAPRLRAVFEATASDLPLAHRMLTQFAGPRWDIVTLGQFSCRNDGILCTLSALHRTVLVRLLDVGPGGLDQERLWEDVWDEEEIRLAALRKAVSRVRDQTGLPISIQAGHYNIARDAWDFIAYDAHTFERLLIETADKEALKRAVEHYGGEFLPGAALSALRWVDARRTYLQQRYLDALERLGAQHEAQNPGQAIHYYQRVLQIDGCREQTAIQLMRLAARFGNHSLVSATFEQLTEALRTIDARPSTEIKTLHRELLNVRPS